MDRQYLVFSADWEMEVPADSHEDALSKGTKLAFDTFGQSFMLAKTVVVVKKKGDLRSYDSIAVLEDLNLYFLANQLRIFLKNKNEQNLS